MTTTSSVLWILLYLFHFKFLLASEYSYDDIQHDARSMNNLEPLIGYSFDVCIFTELAIACPPRYIISEITTEYSNQGYCGCYRFDLANMSNFLKARCLGSVSCKSMDRELKVYDQMYANNFPANCGSVRRIRYNCEPAQSLCENLNLNLVTKYATHINLLSPNYPNSYPGNGRPVCATEVSTESSGTSDSMIKVTIQDADILNGEHTSMCDGNTLHLGATLPDLGHGYWIRCAVASSSFQIQTPLKIIYHYHYNPTEYRRGVFLKIAGTDPNSIIELKNVEYQPVIQSPKTVSTPTTPSLPTDSTRRKQLESFPQNPPEESGNQTVGSNMTNRGEATVILHPYKGPLLTAIVVGTVSLVLLVLLIAALCLWRRRHSSWKNAMAHVGIFLGCNKSRRMSINEPPTRLSSRPSSGSTINPYAYSATFPGAGNQYTEPLNVYVNAGGKQRSSNVCRSSDIYDDVQAQGQSLVGKEPTYDNHIMVQAVKEGKNFPICLQADKMPASTSKCNVPVNIKEELYTRPAMLKKKSEDDGYDTGISTTSLPLQEGENLLVENELYHSKNSNL